MHTFQRINAASEPDLYLHLSWWLRDRSMCIPLTAGGGRRANNDKVRYPEEYDMLVGHCVANANWVCLLSYSYIRELNVSRHY